MSDKELFEKYATICDHRQSRLMDVQETALFMALGDMLRRGAEAADEIERLRADNAALRADAERYRWLVENAKHIPWSKQFPGLNADTGLDAAIDAAIAPAKEQS